MTTAIGLSSKLSVSQKMPILAKNKIIFSDKAHFDLGGYVNKQNCLIWGTENPHAYIKKPMCPKPVTTVWCGFWFRGITGPFFFENEHGEAVTVNGHHIKRITSLCHYLDSPFSFLVYGEFYLTLAVIQKQQIIHVVFVIKTLRIKCTTTDIVIDITLLSSPCYG